MVFVDMGNMEAFVVVVVQFAVVVVGETVSEVFVEPLSSGFPLFLQFDGDLFLVVAALKKT